jgi:transcriptional regulator with XRE-family HTH domain
MPISVVDKIMGQQIKKLREEAGYGLEEFAKLSGLNIGEYELGESGERRFSLRELYPLARRLGVKYRSILAAVECEVQQAGRRGYRPRP